ncbi:MAG: hypothetical protein MZW92_38445 [Comamonadaceae bacterium]|nr:hypothetical protein [Comamonadaceae bacterium]
MIIAGFGRFGQIVGRLLFASGIRAIVLDHDPDQIETAAQVRLQGVLRRRHAPRPARRTAGAGEAQPAGQRHRRRGGQPCR